VASKKGRVKLRKVALI